MLKKTVTLVLFFGLFFVLVSGLVMFTAPPARVASWADWGFLGLSRQAWEGAHLAMGLLVVAAGLVHAMLHADAFLDHLRDDDGMVIVFTKPFFAGGILVVGLFAAALAGAPPMAQLARLADHLQERAAETYGEPPYALAERSTLADFARRMGMDTEKALALLRLKNIKADSGDLTLAEIARQNRVAPGGVFEALKMVMEPSGGTTTVAGLPKEPPPGLGRRKLSDICEEYGLDLAQVLGRLSTSGFKAQPAWTLAEIAKASNVLPIAVYDALRSDKAPASVAVEVATPTEPATSAPAAAPSLPPAQPTPAAPAPAAPTQTGQPAQAPVSPQPAYQPQPAASAPSPAQPPVPGYAPAQQPPAPGYPQSAAPGYQPPATGHAPATPGYQAPGYAPMPPSGATATPGYTPATPGYAPAVPGGAPGYAPTQPPAHAAPAAPVTPPPGLEKMMLQSFCREYDIPLSVAVQRLGRHRITAFGDMSFEELALENNRTPADIMRLVTTP
ncbi:DUF4405 domain-containing protein [Solidesulfovibrio magneticus]|uniref:Hypothetical membrane protein n=1 Tax=Solidesulfovibrio magneticus (strain ATCC 700980 / DSM 13731 / RS-1) TaxID=573370 RepID=C4XNX5_SOLM1|nr:DUF4405 domain-containing protein [Solidesulfovibrio magneticus]BAH77476.1 hypothetical membrane protein [Solidesulfovibrio magneticus RS-1]